MERFMIDVSAFPVVDKDERNVVMEWGSRPSSPASVRSTPLELNGKISGEDDEDEAGPSGADTPSRRNRSRKDSEPNEPAFDIGVDTNLVEQMRAALIFLATRCAQLKPLPDKCSLNIAMELKDEVDVDPPIGQPQA
jgi:mitotic spindle assembly checkpoint protein MAD2B